MIGRIRRGTDAMIVRVSTLAIYEGGQALIEYALIISLVALVSIGVLSTTGLNIKSLLTKVASDV